MRPLKFAAAFLVSLALLLAAPVSAQGALTLPTVESADVAAMAAQTLANSGSKESIPVLRRMLNHPSLIVRYYAAYGLGKLGDKESVKALNDSLWLKENDTPDEKSNPPFSFDGPTRMIYLHGGYRQMVCWALRQLGDTSADKRFIEILEDPDTTPRELKKRIAELIVQLGDVKWEKREEAQNALAEIGDAARRQLEEAAKSVDMEVAQRASELLKPLADTSLTRRVEAFRCLGQLGTEAAFKAMCKVAENDKVDFVAKGYSIRLREMIDSGLTLEQHKTLAQLSGKNKNLPNRGQVSEPRVQPPNPMAAKIDAAKSAQALKDLFIEQQKAGASGLENIIYAMRDYELGEVEDWMVNYISDSRDKNRDGWQQGVCRAMLYALSAKGTEKCLPLLQRVLEDDKLATAFRLEVLKDIHNVLGRCKPERRDLLLASVDEYALTMMLKDHPDDAKFLIESSKMKREEVEDKMLEVLRRPAAEPAMQTDYAMRDVCFRTLLSWRSPKLVDYAIEALEKSNGHNDVRICQVCDVLKTLDRKDKLPDLKKFYERTHFDWNGIVTRTMYLLGDKDVPKMVLAEARAGKPDKDTLECDPYLRLLMYEDIDCQKYFFDSLMKGVPGLERVLNDMLYSYAVGYGIGSNPVNFELAGPAIEKILMNSPSRFRAHFIRKLEEYALDEPALRQAIQRYAEHAMDVCEQARKLIPQLGDKNADARKKTREELEKLGPDAAPAFAEFDKYPDPEIRKVLKELLEPYKSSDMFD